MLRAPIPARDHPWAEHVIDDWEHAITIALELTAAGDVLARAFINGECVDDGRTLSEHRTRANHPDVFAAAVQRTWVFQPENAPIIAFTGAICGGVASLRFGPIGSILVAVLVFTGLLTSELAVSTTMRWLVRKHEWDGAARWSIAFIATIAPLVLLFAILLVISR